eukprot:6096199-Alexandrium_andersonii.AAC.1
MDAWAQTGLPLFKYCSGTCGRVGQGSLQCPPGVHLCWVHEALGLQNHQTLICSRRPGQVQVRDSLPIPLADPTWGWPASAGHLQQPNKGV